MRLVAALPRVKMQLRESPSNRLSLNITQQRGAISGATVGWQSYQVVEIKDASIGHGAQLSEPCCGDDLTVGLDENDLIASGGLVLPPLQERFLVEMRSEFSECWVAALNKLRGRGSLRPLIARGDPKRC